MLRSLPMLLLGCSLGTQSEPAPAPPASSVPPRDRPVRDADYWVERTDDALDSALTRTCERALERGRPVLLQFSAPWCTDCRRMRTLSSAEPLHGELAHWQSLVIDPGRFERHKELLEAFEVSRLATWVAAAPSDCKLPATGWSRLAKSSFEPVTGEPVSADDLTAWLRAARAEASGPPSTPSP